VYIYCTDVYSHYAKNWFSSQVSSGIAYYYYNCSFTTDYDIPCLYTVVREAPMTLLLTWVYNNCLYQCSYTLDCQSISGWSTLPAPSLSGKIFGILWPCPLFYGSSHTIYYMIVKNTTVLLYQVSTHHIAYLFHLKKILRPFDVQVLLHNLVYARLNADPSLLVACAQNM